MENNKKATVEEIKDRFDKDVERFSQLEIGQQTTIDAPLTMELCTEAAKKCTPNAKELLDIGCGAGNYTIKMNSKIQGLNCTLLDLSLPMLERAQQRVSQSTSGSITVLHGDVRTLDLPENHYDIILAAAVFHHLRSDQDWEVVFRKIYNLLKPGGSLWISDLISHEIPVVQDLFDLQYGDYIEKLGGADYRKKVMEYVAYEDSPRPVTYQIELMKKVGFYKIELLHKNGLFAAFGGVK